MTALGSPHLHLRETSSTNDRARDLALAGAPHGTLVTAGRQSAGRGRQGRTWVAPEGRALLASLLLRDPPPLLTLAAAVAIADVCAAAAPDGAVTIKWPNDVLLDDRKVSGILAEGRPQEGWAILGMGLNVAVTLDDLGPELSGTAGTLGLEPAQLGAVTDELMVRLEAVLELSSADLLDAWRARDALRGREISWNDGSGVAAGVDAQGRLIVEVPGGDLVYLDAGEVHLSRDAASAE